MTPGAVSTAVQVAEGCAAVLAHDAGAQSSALEAAEGHNGSSAANPEKAPAQVGVNDVCVAVLCKWFLALLRQVCLLLDASSSFLLTKHIQQLSAS